jgi:membrane-bound metal-dependent hydrolase YbcI (DUF457 family)
MRSPQIPDFAFWNSSVTVNGMQATQLLSNGPVNETQATYATQLLSNVWPLVTVLIKMNGLMNLVPGLHNQHLQHAYAF